MHWFIKNICNYDLFINIGAGFGEYSLVSLKKRIPTYIFEPNPELFKIIYYNLRLNELSKFKLYPYAIGSRNEIKKFCIIENLPIISYLLDNKQYEYFNLQLKKRYIKVFVKPLREFEIKLSKYKHPLILIDVEGNELEVFKGISESLIIKSDFFVEVKKDNNWLSKIQKVLNKKGLILKDYDFFQNVLFK